MLTIFRPLKISIHALREEGDLESSAQTSSYRPISIHALREEGDFILLSLLRQWV